jgi:hypothetical protein
MPDMPQATTRSSRTLVPRPGRARAYDLHQWGFCDGCGDPYPWANRQELISQLLNLLDEEEITAHDRLTITEDLERLKTVSVGDDPETERRVVASIKRGAPGFARGLAAEVLTKVFAEGLFS